MAIRGKDGVVFAVEKIVRSKLYERSANKRIFSIDKHIGMAVAGLMADSRQLVEIARDEAANFRSEYGSNVPLRVRISLCRSFSQCRTFFRFIDVIFLFQQLTDRVGMYVHAHTLYSSVRPFGCSVMFGCFDTDGPSLYMVDPSGIYHVRLIVLIDMGLLTVDLVFAHALFVFRDITAAQLAKRDRMQRQKSRR